MFQREVEDALGIPAGASKVVAVADAKAEPEATVKAASSKPEKKASRKRRRAKKAEAAR